MLRLFRYLSALGSRRLLASLVLALLAGFASTWAVYAMRALVAAPTQRSIAQFGVALASFVACSLLSRRSLSILSTDLARREQLRVLDRVLRLSFEDLEQVGVGRLRHAFNEDVNVLSSAVVLLPGAVIALVTVVTLLVYLGFLSRWLMLWTAAASLPFVVIGIVLELVGDAVRDRGWESDLRLQELFRFSVKGAKELRLHRGRRAHLERVELAERSATRTRARVTLGRITAFADVSVRAGLLSVVMAGIYVAHRVGLGPGSVSSFVVAAITMTASFFAVVNASRGILNGRRALERLETFGSTLDAHHFDDAEVVASATAFERLELRGVRRSYAGEVGEDPTFELGPIDFSLRPGEVVFIVGSNGSGKSTFLKLLTGLYRPHEGTVCHDGAPVAPASLGRYRSLFSAVFSDFVLFAEVLGSVAEATKHLRRLDLDTKVQIREGRFSTITELSTGQRKRLALVSALADDRPIFVFDEWAADQDPTYRRFFYAELLPELKARGKSVVCVTHDDEHFSRADRVVHFAEGRIVREDVRAPSA